MAEDLKEPTIDTPELILKDAVLRSKKLDAEADEALSRNDAATCRQKLAERARLIADLPLSVKEAMAKGQSFPEDGLRQLDDFSALANKALKDGRPFVLSAFLTPKGSSVGEPSPLEKLVSGLYPLETEAIK